ncbi:MAG: short-chain dehydrogenase [Deltaproteobacteria bacterium]|nr:short-chain dehydrogenase [Deltaproteobacteria bacterium]
MSYPGLEGKVAVVTGSGGGIGEQYARALTGEGVRVVVAEIDEQKGQAVADSISAGGGEALFVRTDVSSEDSTQAMAAAAIETFGGIDFLVNNAALFGGMKTESMLQVDWDYYKKFMDINMDGALLCTRACYSSMMERGGGSIVNQSSTAAWMGVGYYGLAKFAINGLTHCLTREMGHMNIRVNAIAPGPTDTEALHAQTPDEYKDALVASIPISRLGRPQDMADACLWLLSDASSWVNGQLLAVDGGQVIRG